MSEENKQRVKKVGDFEILSELGRGGMGVVYKARDTKLQRLVALKFLPASLKSQGTQAVERFLREARSAAQLIHPNVVAVHSIVEHKDLQFIVMEYVEGTSLDQLLAKWKKLTWEEATKLIIQAARGLAAAHGKGIIHRDIKPSNIMVADDGTVKVADFGLARRTEESLKISHSGQVVGTPLYMSPEQCEGKKLDHRSDIYSLGATYYYLLTSRHPFEGGSALELMRKHVDSPLVSPREYDHEIPDSVCTIIAGMMAKKRENRYESAEVLISDLEKAQAGITLDSLKATATDADMTPPTGEEPVGEWAVPQTELEEGEAEKTPSWQIELRDRQARETRNLTIITAVSFAALIALVIAGFVIFGKKRDKPRRIAKSSKSGSRAVRKPKEVAKAVIRAKATVEPETKSAKELFDEASTFEKANPNDWDGIIAKYQIVVNEHWEGEWVERAEKKIEECRIKKIDAAAQEQYEKVKSEAEKLLADGKYGEAINKYDTFRRQTDSTKWQEQANSAIVSAEKKAAQAFAKAKAQTQGHVDANEYEKAIEIYRGIASSYGIKKYEDEANKEIASLETMLEDREGYETLAYQIDCLLAEGKYGEAQTACDEAIKKLTDEPEKELLEAYRDQISRIEEFWKAVAKGVNGEAGRENYPLTLKGGTIRGELKGVEGDQIVLLRPGGGERKFPLNTLGREESLRFGRKELDDDASETHLILAAFLQEEGLRIGQEALKDASGRREKFFSESEVIFKEAESVMSSAVQAGASVEIYIKSLEAASERQAKAKLEAEAQDMYAKVKAAYESDEPFELRELVKELKEKYSETKLWRYDGDLQDPPLSKVLAITENLGDVITVRQDGKGDYTSIQAAVDAVKKPNSLVEIQDSGVYRERLVLSGGQKEGIRIYGMADKFPIIENEGLRVSSIEVNVKRATIQKTCLVTSGGAETFSVASGSAASEFFTLRNNVMMIRTYGVFTGSLLGLRLVNNLIMSPGGVQLAGGHRWTSDAQVKNNVLLEVFVTTDYAAQRVQIENNIVVGPVSPAGANPGATFGLRILNNTIIGGIIVPWGGLGSCRDWTVRDNIATGITVNKESIPEGKITHCCFYGPKPYLNAAKPGKGCFTVDPKKYPTFRDEKNFDFRLHPKSPCRGKAPDGGDIGARITPHMWEMLQLARKIRDNDWKVTPELLKRHVEEQKASKQGRKSRSRKRKK